MSTTLWLLVVVAVFLAGIVVGAWLVVQNMKASGQ